MTTFFTSDHHFGHRRVIELCNRPFADIDEMNQALIAAWNSVVGPEDTVWHLGDFAYRSAQHPSSYFHRLNGIKHLVVGNHDSEATLGLPWTSMSQVADIVVEGQRILLYHYPMLEWYQMHRGAIHLFGHVHGNTPGMPGSLDVGVDAVGWAPLSFAQVIERIGEWR